MVDEEKLKRLRALGIKEVSLDGKGEISHVEFFPLSALDLSDKLTDDAELDDPRDRPTDAPPSGINIPPALARIFKNGSVS